MSDRIHPPRLHAVLALSAVAALSLASCGSSSNPVAPAGDNTGTAAAGSIKVGSADFSESVLLAEMYAGALKAKGVNVSTGLNIGAREAYLKGLTDGSINLIPEYTGALALYFKKDFAATDPDEVYTQLKGLLPEQLTLLDKSAAESKDSITVTKETAEKYRLTTISDLAPVAKDLTLGAPPEFSSRAQGIAGLTKTYGVTFKSFRALKGQALVQALRNGQIQAANIFTTDPTIEANSFVVLTDNKKLFGAQNIVPLITRSAATPQVTDTLNAVSAKLTTVSMRSLLSKVDVDKQDAKKVAEEWLKTNGLG